MKHFNLDPSDKWVIAAVVASVLLIVFIIAAMIEGNKEREASWATFIQSLDCHVVEERMAQDIYSVPVGKTVMVQSSNYITQAWQCSDGVIYWRRK